MTNDRIGALSEGRPYLTIPFAPFARPRSGVEDPPRRSAKKTEEQIFYRRQQR
jgi:hypothetical protein